MTTAISAKRHSIDELDRQLVSLLDQRAKLVIELARHKGEDRVPMFLPAREAELLEGLGRIPEGEFPREFLQAVFREIISACRFLQQPEKIGVLGEKFGWVHDVARRQFGSAASLTTYEHGEEILKVLARGEVKEAFFALDAGDPDLPMMLEALMGKRYSVIGEVVASRGFALATRGPKEMTGLEEIFITRDTLSRLRRWAVSLSFPVRISICRSMEEAVENLTDGRKVGGVIPSGLAKDFHCTILQDGLNPVEEFPLRCLTISNRPPATAFQTPGKGKASILVSPPAQPGGLLRILDAVREAGLEVLSVETFPYRKKPFPALVWIDFSLPGSGGSLETVIAEIEARSQLMAFLGAYPVF